MSDVMLRPLRAADVQAVLDLQAQCYEARYLESAAAFAAKLDAAEAVETCWMAWRGARPLAYLVGLPACPDSLPALDAPVLQRPVAPRFLYLHDLAVAPDGRSLGLGRRLLQRIEQRARALCMSRLGLVAVQGSVPYWQRQGFAAPAAALPSALAHKLASFGPEACWLERRLPAQAGDPT